MGRRGDSGPVRQGRVRYRDIVVTARSMDPYWEQLEGVFAQYDIPLFQAG